MKTLSLGAENFESIIRGSYYIDHSFLIEDIENTAIGAPLLFLRPRRFGKSLALSMLHSFYSSDAEKRKDLFSDLYISSNEFLMNMESIPTIFIQLKDIKEKDYSSLLSSISSLMRKEFARYEYTLSNPSNAIYREDAAKLLKGDVSEGFLKDSLYALCEIIHNGTGKKPVLLIDEYDTRIAFSKSSGYYDEALELLRSMFSKALKGNNHLHKAVLTGVVKIAKVSLFSDMNNLIVDDGLSHRFREPFAFTKKETIQLLRYFSVEADIEKVEEMYGGYRFSGDTFLNPWSVLSFVSCGGEYAPYWTSTASNSQIFDFYQDDVACLEGLNLLLENKVVPAVGIGKEFNYEYDSDNYDSFFLLLRSAGYLTVAGAPSFSAVDLKMPNKEIENIFVTEVMDRFLGMGASSLTAIKRAFLQGNESALESLIRNNLLSAFSYYEFGSEKAYQVMLLTLSALLFEHSVVKSEVLAGEGRCDLMISPKNEGQFGAVIEVKALKARTTMERLSSSAENALKQIKTHLYLDELYQRDARPIYAYGMSFQGKKVAVKKEKIR